MEAVIETKKVVKKFGARSNERVVIDEVDLAIYKGDFTVIMGSSGAGKSTLMYMLSGMDTPSAGEIWFDGTDITRMSSEQMAVFRRKHCGFVFQQIYMLDGMSLLDNALATGLLLNKNKREVLDRAEKLFDRVNLDKVTRNKKSNQVSGGECQRAGIVRAAINEPEVIFADEPTGALNSSNSTAVLDVLTDLNAGGQSIIMVTHDKKSALRGNRVIYLKDGKIFGELELPKYSANDEERVAKLDGFLKEMGW